MSKLPVFITLTHKSKVVLVFNYAPRHTHVRGNILNVGHKWERVVRFTSRALGPHKKKRLQHPTDKNLGRCQARFGGGGGVHRREKIPATIKNI